MEQLRRAGARGHHGRTHLAWQPGAFLHVVEAGRDLGLPAGCRTRGSPGRRDVGLGVIPPVFIIDKEGTIAFAKVYALDKQPDNEDCFEVLRKL